MGKAKSKRFTKSIFILTFLAIGFTVLGNHIPKIAETVHADELSQSIPILVDLGAGKCIPCRQMKPVLEELEKEYVGKFEVVFYDVWEDSKPAREYGIHAIPTQIFIDEGGRELFRHVGFYSKEEILQTWKDLGYDFDK